MEEVTCSTNRCKKKAKFYNCIEDCYYCKECAYALFNPNACKKIGSTSVIKHMVRLSQNLLSKVKDYAISERLEAKWKQSLEQMMLLENQLKEINGELERILKEGKLKDLDRIEQRSFDLKFQITENEAYKKYLLHKDINEERLREANAELNLTLTQAVKDMVEIRADEDVTTIKERVKIWQNHCLTKSSIEIEFEEF